MLFDSHAHLDDDAFNEDRSQVIQYIKSAGIGLLLDPGCTLESSRKAAALASEYDFIYFAAGIHPEELGDFTDEKLSAVYELTGNSKCAAIGEIGLDYYWDSSRKQEQKELFQKQLAYAFDCGKPVIIHDREAHGDCLETVRRFSGLTGVFHCFSGSVEMAHELLKLGWYIGFDGPITYKNAKKALNVLENCPIDRILIETDSPYLSPVPVLGKRNDPANLHYICKKIAEVKGLSTEKTAEITTANACNLFGIPCELTD